MTLTRNLSRGSRGEDVAQLQRFLISRGHLASGNDTGYFGTLTEAAVKSFQARNNIVSSGSPATTGYGSAGPRTRSALAQSGAGPSGSTAAPPATSATQQQTSTKQITSPASCPPVPPPVATCSGSWQSVQDQRSCTTSYQCRASLAPVQTAAQQTAPAQTTTQQHTTPQTTSTPASCAFNGQTVANGSPVTAYQSSSVAYGSQCVSEQRMCTSGTFSGSYTNDTCTVSAAASCTLNGTTVPHSTTETFYNDAALAYGDSCTAHAQSRTCSNGTFSGSDTYQYSSCSVGDPDACTFNSQTIASDSSVTAYQSAMVTFGQTCQAQTRLCTNGTLSGSYQYASCAVGTPLSCTWNGQSIAHGTNATAYQTPSVQFGQSCVSQTRTCTNGTLSGSNTYQYSSCTVSQPSSCTFNGQSIQSGSSVIAYRSSSGSANEPCVSQQRMCSNGVLSGSFEKTSCDEPYVYPQAYYSGSGSWSDALDKALIAANGAKPVYLRAGTYTIDRPLVLHTGAQLLGESRDSVVVSYASSSVKYIAGFSNITIRNLTIQCNGYLSSGIIMHGTASTYVSSGSIDNVHVTGCDGQGISTQYAHDLNIINVESDNNAHRGLNISAFSYNVRASNIKAHHNKLAEIVVGHGSHDNTIDGAELYGSYNGGLWLDQGVHNNKITSMNIHDPQPASTNPFIYGVVIRDAWNNILDGITISGYRYGILMRASEYNSPYADLPKLNTSGNSVRNVKVVGDGSSASIGIQLNLSDTLPFVIAWNVFSDSAINSVAKSITISAAAGATGEIRNNTFSNILTTVLADLGVFKSVNTFYRDY